MRRWVISTVLVALVAASTFMFLTRPDTVDPSAFAALSGDTAAGQIVFVASGCASCHAAADAKEEAKLVLSGGQKFPSPFGTFVAPNISPTALSGWTLTDMANALRHGTSPEGTHYFPAFPYGSYALLTDQQIADLWAYLQTLPPDETPNAPHEVGFPFNLRIGVGAWKFMYFDPEWVLTGDLTPEQTRGRVLVEAMGHCAECHTPRTALGGLKRDAWLSGAPSPSGRGTIPALTPAELSWSAGDIAYYLETGFTPDFDSAGGHMVAVIENFAQLPASDREAVAAYLKSLP